MRFKVVKTLSLTLGCIFGVWKRNQEAGLTITATRVSYDASSEFADGGSIIVSRRPRLVRLQFSRVVIGSIFACADAVAILAASLLGAGGYQLLVSQAAFNLDFHIAAGVTAAFLYLLIGRSFGSYQVESILAPSKGTSQVLWQWFLTSLSLSLLAFLLKIGVQFSRGSIICFAVLALVFLFASRRLMRAALNVALRRGRMQGRRVVVVGLRDELAAVGEHELLQRFGMTEVERIAFPCDEDWARRTSRNITLSLDKAVAAARDHGAEEIVLALSWNDMRSIDLVRDWLRSSPLPIRLLPDQRIRYLFENPSFSVDRAFSIELQRAPLSKFEQALKRALDVVGATIVLFLLCFVMLLVAVAIKLESRGPVFFRQQRTGFNSKRFMIFKFRTMAVMEDGNEVTQATRQDSRVTRVGRVLRSTSIDELPQLFNVLTGEMSLIGPRPHAIAHDTYYGDLLSEYAFRHHVKPGMTGWAQVNGCRGETAQIEHMQQRIDFDLWYIKNWSVALDFAILLKTCVEVTRRRNAY